MKNYIKTKLKDGKVSVGAWIGIGHPDISERLANVGFDWLLFDMEHSPLDRETVQVMIQSMSYQNDCIPIVRVPWNNVWLVKHVLDIGAYGVIIPLISTKEEAETAVSYCKYPPKGVRGCGPRHAAFRDKEYMKTANDELLIVLQIENKEGLKNIDEICSVEGVDVCYIGPSDLSMSLGVHRQLDSEVFKDAKLKIVDACKSHGVAVGTYCSPTNVNNYVEEGFQFVNISGDTSYLVTGARAALNSLVTGS